MDLALPAYNIGSIKKIFHYNSLNITYINRLIVMHVCDGIVVQSCTHWSTYSVGELQLTNKINVIFVLILNNKGSPHHF